MKKISSSRSDDGRSLVLDRVETRASKRNREALDRVETRASKREREALNRVEKRSSMREREALNRVEKMRERQDLRRNILKTIKSRSMMAVRVPEEVYPRRLFETDSNRRAALVWAEKLSSTGIHYYNCRRNRKGGEYKVKKVRSVHLHFVGTGVHFYVTFDAFKPGTYNDPLTFEASMVAISVKDLIVINFVRPFSLSDTYDCKFKSTLVHVDLKF